MLRAVGTNREVAKNLLMRLQLDALLPHLLEELMNAVVEKEYAVTRIAQEGSLSKP